MKIFLLTTLNKKVQNLCILFLTEINKIKVNWYIEVYDRSKYLTSIIIDKKDKNLLKKCEEMFDKINFLIKINNDNSDDYNENTWKSELTQMMIYL